MKRGKALLAIFSAGLLLTACGNPSKKGVEYLEKGEYDQAVEQFEQAIECKFCSNGTPILKSAVHSF